MVLGRKITWRNPFAITSLPWTARVYRKAYTAGHGLRHQLSHRPLRWGFRTLYRLGAGGFGEFDIDVKNHKRRVRFNARNLQFHSLYLTQFAYGTEPATAALLDTLAGDDGVFYDVGSNWGYYSLYIGSRESFRGKIHAFEPMPETYQDLSGAIDQAGLAGQVVAHCTALSDTSGSCTMTVPDGIHSGLATLTRRSGGPQVKTARIDDLNLDAPSLMKIDVEDHECEVLEGSRQTIASARPMIVLENWRHDDHPETSLRPLKLLRELGYELFLPAWARFCNGIAVVRPDEPYNSKPLNLLALVPFAIEERFCFDELCNIFACHHSRNAELEGLFRPIKDLENTHGA